MITDTALDVSRLQGVVAKNSISYAEMALNAIASERIVVPLRSKDDKQRAQATGLHTVVEPDQKAGWFHPKFTPMRSDAVAQVSFTSGTEGAPKGVILSHCALNDAVSRLLDLSAINGEVKEYLGVPVYHSFGFGRCRLIGQVQGAAYIPGLGFSPQEIAAMLHEGAINALSAVPSMLRVLLANDHLFSQCKENLRWIEIGSQPMTADEKLRLRELFPRAVIIQHYGLTEASRSSLLRVDQASEEQLNSVGRAYGHTEFKISDSGRICIRGPHLAQGMLVDGQIQPLTGADGWLETTDLGSMQDGHLSFEGRADNVINCGGQKISAELIEESVRKVFSVTSEVAVARVADVTYGEGVLIAKKKAWKVDNEQLYNTVREVLAEHGVHASGAVHIHEFDELPITDTGKVQRKRLSSEYDSYSSSRVGSDSIDRANTDPLASLMAAVQTKVGTAYSIRPDHSFEDLGLDSIAAVGLTLEFEKILGFVPNGWRQSSFKELALCKDKAFSSVPIAIHAGANAGQTKGTTNQNPNSLGFWALVKEDFITHESDWLSQGFWAVFNHRFGNWRMGVKSKVFRAPLTIIYRVHRRMVQVFCGIKLDYTVKLGRRVKLEHFGGMILGAHSIEDDVTIRQNTTFGIRDLSNLQAKPTIERGVNIGTGAVVVGDVTIGRYSVLGPNTVVDRNVPPFSIVTAAPSQVSAIDAL